MSDKEMIEELAHNLYCKQDEYNMSNPFEIAKCVIDLGYHKIPEDSVVLTKEEYEKLQENILELKNLEWYKFWHKKHTKEIEDLTTELETYRPTKLSGHGQCKCSKCGRVCWTDWFSRYKGQTLCNSCLKELIEKDNNDYRKETAKEILQEIMSVETEDEKWLNNEPFVRYVKKMVNKIEELAKQYGVEE